MSKAASKWAVDEEASAEAAAQRKKEKEEKKRLKEEKLRKAAAAAVSTDVAASDERPTKRQRLSPEQEPQQEQEQTHVPGRDEGANLVQFPSRPFGPCGNVDQFEQLNNIEEGSYGMVSRARRKGTGTIVALKHLKMEHTADGFPVTGLREIQTLKASHHPNVVTLLEVVMGASLKE